MGKGGELRPPPFSMGFAVGGGRLDQKHKRFSGPEPFLSNLKYSGTQRSNTFYFKESAPEILFLRGRLLLKDGCGTTTGAL
jgi:hypothetical protein